MNVKTLLVAITMTASTLLPLGGHAHTMMHSSSPAKGEVLKLAPKTIQLEFGKPVKLTQLKLVADGKDIPLILDPAAAEAKSFNVPVPVLAPGKYQAKWSIISNDGHAMTGRIAFTIAKN